MMRLKAEWSVERRRSRDLRGAALRDLGETLHTTSPSLEAAAAPVPEVESLELSSSTSARGGAGCDDAKVVAGTEVNTVSEQSTAQPSGTKAVADDIKLSENSDATLSSIQQHVPVACTMDILGSLQTAAMAHVHAVESGKVV